MKYAKTAILGTAVLLMAVIYVAGGLHLVYGSTVPTHTAKKLSWSLSETVINMDEVGNMPMIVARSKYPMYVAKIEQEITAARETREKSVSDGYVNMTAQSGLGNVKAGHSRAAVVEVLGEPDSRTGPFQNSAGVSVETLYYTGAGTVTVSDGIVSTTSVMQK